MITIKHLRIFCEVAKTKSMSKAAENLFISQPSVSTKLQEIEKYYNVTLFQRHSKTLGISEEGKIFYEQAKKILDELDNLDNIFFHNRHEITIRIGTTLTTGSTVLPTILNSIKSNHPSMNFRVIVDNTQEIENKLLDNQLDIAIVEGDINNEYITSTPIIPDMMILACSNKHPIAYKKIITPEELAHQSFILREKGSGTRAMLEQYLISNKVPYHITWESRSWESIKQAVINNQGITLISARLIEEELRNQKLKTIRINNHTWNRFFSLCHHKNKVWNENLEIFKQEVEKQSYCPIIELLKNKRI
jgi:DNA-binding transcriptional LysR family regulator